MTESIPSDHQRSDVVVVQQGAEQVNSLQEGSSAHTATLLELVSRLSASGGAHRLPSEVLTSCGAVLADPNPEVVARTAAALGASLQLCQQCGSTQDDVQQLLPVLAPVAQQAVLAMQRHAAEPAVLAACLQLLLRLAGCSGCRAHFSREQQDVLGAAGAVPAAAAALAALASPAVSDGTDAGAASAQQEQWRTQALAEGLQALCHMCTGHAGNLGQLACAGPAGGVQAVLSAMAAASNEWSAEEHGLMLLAMLACRDEASQEEVQAAALAIWRAGQAQVERRLVEVGRGAVWAMARVLQRMLRPAAPAAPALLPELLLQGTAVVLATLQSCDKRDDPLTRHCCDFLSVAASAVADQPAVAAALLSREAAIALLMVAGQAQEVHTQASALRTLYRLCQAGACGLTWQDLAAGRQLDDAELASGAASIAAAVFVVAGAGGQAAAAAAAAGPKDVFPRPPRDALAVQLYGLAAVGAMLAAIAARSPAAAASLAVQLHREHLGAAQEGVAAACGMLARSAELLAMLEQQPGAAAGMHLDGAAEPPLPLDFSRHCSHVSAGEEALTWRPAADAVRGVVALLRAAPDGVNTPDREGLSLLHRLAIAGHPRCLELLFELALLPEGSTHEAPPTTPSSGTSGPNLDLLVRTRTGANALQLAKQHRHEACVRLLEGATLRAAEERQAALLAELEELEAEEGQAAGGKKSKKKKTVSRSMSFAADQPEGKTQKQSAGSTASDAEQDEEMAPAASLATSLRSDAGAVAAAEAMLRQQLELEQRLQAQRERDDAYEQALEARRQELAALHAAAQSAREAGTAAVSMPDLAEEQSVRSEASHSSSDGREQPGTPDQQDDQPATPNAAASAASALNGCGNTAGSGDSSSGTSSSPEPQLSGEMPAAPAATAPQLRLPGHGSLLPGFAGQLPAVAPLPGQPALSGFGATPPQQQSALSALAGAMAAAPQAARMPMAGLNRQSGLGTTGALGSGSLFASGSSLFGSASLAGRSHMDLASPHSSDLGGSSLSSSMAGSPFLQTLGAGSPPPSRTILGRPPLSCSSPSGSSAAYTSPGGMSGLLAQQRAGLPPLPGGRQYSLSGGASAAGEADHMLSMHLQDALFVGSPAPSPSARGAAGRALGSPQHRHSLFASLGDADGSRLLSGGLSCLDSGDSGLLRHLSSSRSGSGSGSGSVCSAADSLMASLRHHQSGWAHGEDLALPPGIAAASPRGRALGSPQSIAHRAAAAAAAAAALDPNSDESAEPTRHLWIGNLGTRTPRVVLKSIFERFGTVDDVVTFPGRMYAFVNFRSTEEAVAAFEVLQDQQVSELTGDRRLLIKYRPAKKAAIHLRALGLVDEDGSPTDDRLDLDRDGNSSEPSPRIWLGNIAPTATSKNLHAVLGRFGVLTDAAVFPARIGPLGYAFVKFERLEDAVRAFEALNNTVVPPLSGSKQLKMRYKPANDGPVGRSEDPSDLGKALMVPSRHLWLGNITQKPTDEQVLDVFASFGKVDSVRVFPVKAYAFVNYADIASAIKAMQAMEGMAIPQLTGVKPLVMRYQQESNGSAASTPKPLTSVGSASCLLPRVASEAAMSAALGLNTLPPGANLSSLLATPGASLTAEGSEDGAMPVANLSNKLNPNNIHYDSELAERYKHMNRREKDLMWAADSLLHPADPAKQGMLRSHSMGYLNSPATATAAAAANAQAQATMALLLQQQQQQGGGAGAGLLGAQSPVANGLMPNQLLSPHQLAPNGHTPPAQLSQVATGASYSQLTAVLNNLTALRRTGSVPSPVAGGLGVGGMHSVHGAPLTAQQHSAALAQLQAATQGLQALGAAQSMPLPGMQQAQHAQQDYLAMLLQQQQAQQASVRTPPLTPTTSFGGAAAAASPSDQIHRLSSMLANHSLGGGSAAGNSRSATPLLHGGSGPSTASVLSPQHSSHLSTPHAHSLASALGHFGQGQATPASSGGLSAQLGGPGAAHEGGFGPAGLPQQFLCPLTRQVMGDPVVAADGVTYERHAISEWMAYKGVSPITHMPLHHRLLTPNTVLKASLINLVQQHCSA